MEIDRDLEALLAFELEPVADEEVVAEKPEPVTEDTEDAEDTEEMDMDFEYGVDAESDDSEPETALAAEPEIRPPEKRAEYSDAELDSFIAVMAKFEVGLDKISHQMALRRPEDAIRRKQIIKQADRIKIILNHITGTSAGVATPIAPVVAAAPVMATVASAVPAARKIPAKPAEPSVHVNKKDIIKYRKEHNIGVVNTVRGPTSERRPRNF